MPSFQDSAVIFFLALLLFGPKKLPELARQLGKLMGEFRRASNEFRMQMEDELRVAEQAEQQKKIAALQAAAPVINPDEPGSTIPEPEHPHLPPYTEPTPENALPIATSGDLSIMPPETGLPTGRSALTPVLDTIPHAQPEPPHVEADLPSPPDRSTGYNSELSAESEAPLHG